MTPLEQLRQDVIDETYAPFNMRCHVWTWDDGNLYDQGHPDGTVTLGLEGYAVIRAGALLHGGELLWAWGNYTSPLTQEQAYLIGGNHLGMDPIQYRALFSGSWAPLNSWKTIDRVMAVRQLDDVIRENGRVHPNMGGLLPPRGYATTL